MKTANFFRVVLAMVTAGLIGIAQVKATDIKVRAPVQKQNDDTKKSWVVIDNYSESLRKQIKKIVDKQEAIGVKNKKWRELEKKRKKLEKEKKDWDDINDEIIQDGKHYNYLSRLGNSLIIDVYPSYYVKGRKDPLTSIHGLKVVNEKGRIVKRRRNRMWLNKTKYCVKEKYKGIEEGKPPESYKTNQYIGYEEMTDIHFQLTKGNLVKDKTILKKNEMMITFPNSARKYKPRVVYKNGWVNIFLDKPFKSKKGLPFQDAFTFCVTYGENPKTLKKSRLQVTGEFRLYNVEGKPTGYIAYLFKRKIDGKTVSFIGNHRGVTPKDRKGVIPSYLEAPRRERARVPGAIGTFTITEDTEMAVRKPEGPGGVTASFIVVDEEGEEEKVTAEGRDSGKYIVFPSIPKIAKKVVIETEKETFAEVTLDYVVRDDYAPPFPEMVLEDYYDVTVHEPIEIGIESTDVGEIENYDLISEDLSTGETVSYGPPDGIITDPMTGVSTLVYPGVQDITGPFDLALIDQDGNVLDEKDVCLYDYTLSFTPEEVVRGTLVSGNIEMSGLEGDEEVKIIITYDPILGLKVMTGKVVDEVPGEATIVTTPEHLNTNPVDITFDTSEGMGCKEVLILGIIL